MVDYTSKLPERCDCYCEKYGTEDIIGSSDNTCVGIEYTVNDHITNIRKLKKRKYAKYGVKNN